MRTSWLSRILRAVCHLFLVFFTALLFCLILLLIADVLRCIGALFTKIGGDTVLTLGKWKFIFREELLEGIRARWAMLCGAAEAVIPAPLHRLAVELLRLMANAFSFGKPSG